MFQGMVDYSVQIVNIYFIEIGVVSLFLFYLLLVKRNFNKFTIPVLLFVITFHTAVLFTDYGTDSRLLPNGYFIGLLSIIGFYEFLNVNSIRKSYKAVAVLLVVLWLFGYAAIVKYRFIKDDNQQIASVWLEENILHPDDNITIGSNAPPYIASPDIISREWFNNKHPESPYFPNKYNETFVIPVPAMKGFGDKIVFLKKDLRSNDAMRWLESKSPDYVIINFSPKYLLGGWPDFFNKSPNYKLIKEFPKYDFLGVSYLETYSYDIFIYKRVGSKTASIDIDSTAKNL